MKTEPETEMSDVEISRALDGKLGTHMLNGLFHELVDTHRNHISSEGYKNLRKIMKALAPKPDPAYEIARLKALNDEMLHALKALRNVNRMSLTGSMSREAWGLANTAIANAEASRDRS